MLEWLWFLNSHPGVTYRNMYGDKDTFRLAFHLAGKASAFWQAGSQKLLLQCYVRHEGLCK